MACPDKVVVDIAGDGSIQMNIQELATAVQYGFEEVEPVLREGLSTPRTVIMEFKVEKEENVYPMVPAGAPITEMLLV